MLVISHASRGTVTGQYGGTLTLLALRVALETFHNVECNLTRCVIFAPKIVIKLSAHKSASNTRKLGKADTCKGERGRKE